MRVVPYQSQHLLFMQLQDGQAYCKAHTTEAHAKALENEYAFTVLAGDLPIGVGGVTDIYEGRGLLWSYIDQRAGPHFIAIHRVTERFLAAMPHRRIEAYTPCEFKAGHRWLKKLGFTLEAERMRNFDIDGGDSAMYARVK